MEILQQVFNHSTDAVLGIDTKGKVRFTNHAFEALTGYKSQNIVNMPCSKVIRGTDMCGKSFCGEPCTWVANCKTNHLPESDFDLIIRRTDDALVLVTIGTSYVPRQLQPQAGHVSIFFSLRPVDTFRLLKQMATLPGEGFSEKSGTTRSKLTPREKEILDLAARGMKTRDIACHLCVSTQTVRSHFKNIYQKIGVHSRTEAVLFSFQKGLAVG